MSKRVITDFENRHQFKNFIKTYKGTFILKFTAEWCGPCKKVKDTVYSLYNESNSKMLMADLDIDKGNNRDVYSSEKVRSIPTFICYVNGERRDVLADSDLEEVQAFFKQCNEY